jgi:hypothetical protein
MSFSIGISTLMAEIEDDFTTGPGQWLATPAGAWSFGSNLTNRLVVDLHEDGYAWMGQATPAPAWSVSIDVEFQRMYRDGGRSGVVGIAMSDRLRTPRPILIADVAYEVSGQVLVTVSWFDGVWREVLSSGWLHSPSSALRITLRHLVHEDRVIVQIGSSESRLYQGICQPISVEALSELCLPGLRANGVRAKINRYGVGFPWEPGQPNREVLRGQAVRAVEDLLSQFWRGSAVEGQIANTWNGYTNNLPDSRGGLWERGTLFQTLYDAWRLTGESSLCARLAADWQRTKRVYTAVELEACGQDSGTNWAVDDAGWSAIMYITAYRVTGDPEALARAKGLVRAAFARWQDDQFGGGGLWYSDARQVKSLYQVALVLAALWIHEVSADPAFLNLAMQSYCWMEGHLLRSDGLYWADYGAQGPVGRERPDDIAEAGSVVFLGGNMAMAIVHGRLHRLTCEDTYRLRALRTVDALASRLSTTNGTYLNDRDAWVNGTFAGEWVRDVLSLRGISKRHGEILRATGSSISANARTVAGTYGASWDGPAEGSGSRWHILGSTAAQIMTSASTVHMLVAAALAADEANAQPAVVALRPQASLLRVEASGSLGWWYRLQGSKNLNIWDDLTLFLSQPEPFSYTLRQALETNEFFRAIPSSEP